MTLRKISHPKISQKLARSFHVPVIIGWIVFPMWFSALRIICPSTPQQFLRAHNGLSAIACYPYSAVHLEGEPVSHRLALFLNPRNTTLIFRWDLWHIRSVPCMVSVWLLLLNPLILSVNHPSDISESPLYLCILTLTQFFYLYGANTTVFFSLNRLYLDVPVLGILSLLTYFPV